MPYTLTMSLLWLLLAGAAGVAVGYLFRGRTSVIATGRHPAAHETANRVQVTDQAAEFEQLRQQLERLDTQLSITVAERDRLRHQLESLDPVAPDPHRPAGNGPVGNGPAGNGPAGGAS